MLAKKKDNTQYWISSDDFVDIDLDGQDEIDEEAEARIENIPLNTTFPASSTTTFSKNR